MATITLLDGSIGQELLKRSGDAATPLWSTQVMMDHPDLIEAVHDSYFKVGATVATTNTYAILRDRLEPAGIADKLEPLTNIALTAARSARDAAGKGRGAGSIGPLGASYRPDLAPSPEEAAQQYAEPVNLMVDHVDMLLLETMASVEQVEGALRACVGRGKPVWLGVTVDDDNGARLRSGESLQELQPVLQQHTPDAILINCSRPEAIGAALDVIKGFDLPFGAYSNGFTHISEAFLDDKPTVDALSQRHALTPEAYADFAMQWVDQGATIVGGCCEVGPAHIEALAGRLQAAGNTIA